MKKYRYDIHWSREQKDLGIKFLDLDDAVDILLKNKINEVFLGGGEPTIDKTLPLFLKKLKELNIRTNVLTNGEFLTEEIVSMADRIAFSIKSLNDEIHMKIVHRSNKNSLKNLERFFNEKFTFETVYIPELGCKNVHDIAIFLDSIKHGLKLRLDPLIPINEKFSEPDPEEIDVCIDFVSRNSTVNIYRIKGSGKGAEVLYP